MEVPPIPDSPTIHAAIVARPDHCVSRTNISPGALKVLYALKGAGFEGYLVGGGVRDLLLGREPKDFDVVTDARPEQVRALFRNSRLIGRRFRLVHVRFGREIIEVATFRSARADEDSEDRVLVDGRILRDNAYGTLEEDAWRRDFTVNCLYYNIRDFSVVDFTDGLTDLRAGTLRLIGDPAVRYREDPVRILRAIRFAAKLAFRIDPASEAPLEELAPLLSEVPPARLFDEVVKLFLGGHAVASFEMLERYGLFALLFPGTARAMRDDPGGTSRRLVLDALANTDTRLAEGKPVTPAFLFAALLWPALVARERTLAAEETAMDGQALDLAAFEVISEQVREVAIPKRFTVVSREIWLLQRRLAKRRGRKPEQLLAHPRFRAAYDFLLLRANAGEVEQELARWWTEAQEGSAAAEGSEPAQRTSTAPVRRRRRRRRRAAQ